MQVKVVKENSIGILVALPLEARCFLKRSLPVGETIAIKKNVLLHIGGIGAQRADLGAKHLLSQGAQSLISWGYAAGLDPIVRPGQLIIPEKIIDSEGNYFFRRF